MTGTKKWETRSDEPMGVTVVLDGPTPALGWAADWASENHHPLHVVELPGSDSVGIRRSIRAISADHPALTIRRHATDLAFEDVLVNLRKRAWTVVADSSTARGASVISSDIHLCPLLVVPPTVHHYPRAASVLLALGDHPDCVEPMAFAFAQAAHLQAPLRIAAVQPQRPEVRKEVISRLDLFRVCYPEVSVTLDAGSDAPARQECDDRLVITGVSREQTPEVTAQYEIDLFDKKEPVVLIPIYDEEAMELATA